MIKKFLKFSFLSMLTFLSVASYAKPSSSVELAYAYVNPDFVSESSPLDLDNESTFTFLFDIANQQNLGMNFRYTQGDFQAGGPIFGLSDIEHWAEINLYKKWFIKESFYIQPSINYHRISISVNPRRNLASQQGIGYGLKIGANLISKIHFALEVSSVDTDLLNDLQSTAEILVPISPQLTWTARLRDYDESDFTIYETGIKWNF